MSYRVLQLSPQSSTRISRRKINVLESWRAPSTNVLDIGLLRSWLEHDSEFDEDGEYGRSNWGTVSGLALSVVISASFWVGVAWVVGHVWK
jgi:hypothetical protein